MVPAKRKRLSNFERIRRIRETACEIGPNDDPAWFGRVFEQVARPSEPIEESAEK
jgi:hypothetical protein